MKYAWIEQHRGDLYGVRGCAGNWAVSRSGYCSGECGRPARARWPMRHWMRRSRRCTQAIKAATVVPASCASCKHAGSRVGHERVRRSLRRQALRPVYTRPYRVTTDSAHQKPVARELLDRRFDGWQLNRAWVADITYIATERAGCISRASWTWRVARIVGWSMSARLKADLVCQALQAAEAVWKRQCGDMDVIAACLEFLNRCAWVTRSARF